MLKLFTYMRKPRLQHFVKGYYAARSVSSDDKMAYYCNQCAAVTINERPSF
ncbi:hypothetical protein ACF0H5_013113 [Mactra antiquata]